MKVGSVPGTFQRDFEMVKAGIRDYRVKMKPEDAKANGLLKMEDPWQSLDVHESSFEGGGS